MDILLNTSSQAHTMGVPRSCESRVVVYGKCEWVLSMYLLRPKLLVILVFLDI